MADGVKVRTNIEDLRQHADYKHLMECFLNGKLEEWLKDREYIDLANRIGALDKDNKDSYVRMCEILNIECINKTPIDIENVERLNYKRNILRQVTTNNEIINNVAKVAFSQDELNELLKKNYKKIYLYSECDGNFILSLNEGIEYVGINNPQVSADSIFMEYLKKGTIKLKNITLFITDDDASSDIKENIVSNSLDNNQKLGNGTLSKEDNVSDDIKRSTNDGCFESIDDFFTYIEKNYGREESEAEKLFFNNNFDNLLTKFIKLSKKGIERANYFLVQLSISGCGSRSTDMTQEDVRRKKCNECNDPLARVQYLYLYSAEDNMFCDAVKEVYEGLRDMALKGDPFACYELYNLFQYGCDYINMDEANEYANLAIKINYPEIFVALGRTKYENEEFKEAFDYFLKASSYGSAWGCYELADCYKYGLGVKVDKKEAYRLYNEAAAKGLALAEYELGDYLYDEESYKDAFDWYNKAAFKYYAPAQNMVGFMYSNGLGCKKSDEKAFYYYVQSARQGFRTAIHNLGHAYFHGIAIKNGKKAQDYRLAMDYFKRAAEDGEAESMYYLGTCYQYGLGTKKDWVKAKKWFEEASKLGNVESKKALRGENHREAPTIESIGNSIMKGLILNTAKYFS